MRRALARSLIVVCALLTASAFGQQSRKPKTNHLSKATVTILEQADQFELLALNPEPVRDATSFHGYTILQTVEIRDTETRKKLISALMQSMQESDGDVANCFNPRHGIRATSKSRHADLVICFECAQVELFGNTKDSLDSFSITSSPQNLFNEVLRERAASTANPLHVGRETDAQHVY